MNATDTNLNEECIPCADGPDQAMARGSMHFQEAGGVIHFGNLQDRLIEHIQAADAVFGCVAWLTNLRILSVLAQKEHCCIVVQKEDLWRPDGKSFSKARVREAYQRLRCGLTRYDFPGLINGLSVASDPTVQPVRCAGVHMPRRGAAPRMHHKFLVFCRISQVEEPATEFDDAYLRQSVEPYAVWTGSFNLTRNATRSLENAIFVNSAPVAWRYMAEFGNVFALSEPLDWESEYVEPEYRIGT